MHALVKNMYVGIEKNMTHMFASRWWCHGKHIAVFNACSIAKRHLSIILNVLNTSCIQTNNAFPGYVIMTFKNAEGRCGRREIEVKIVKLKTIRNIKNRKRWSVLQLAQIVMKVACFANAYVSKKDMPACVREGQCCCARKIMLRFTHKPHLNAEKDHVAVVLVLAAFLNPPLWKCNFETPLVEGFRMKNCGQSLRSALAGPCLNSIIDLIFWLYDWR